MKTYKKFFSVIIILIASISMTLAGPVHIKKKGGKIHIDGTVRYRSVESQTYADGSLKYLICKGRGNNLCDHDASIVVNDVKIPIAEVEMMISKALKNGETSGSGDIQGIPVVWKNAELLDGKYLEYIVDIGKE
ncbi:MAG: hypothetical protein U9N51_08360 [Bacteroidota bacterium]|nr:hypothetical protein [Bacteroidota bacterium]